MKARRVIFWILMAANFIAGRYTGLKIFYIILFVQILLVALGVGLAYWTINSFKFNQTIDSVKAVKGSRAKLSIEITNETVIALSMMEISVSLAIPAREQVLSLCIVPFSQTSFEVDLELPYRGIYDVGMREIKITDIFGITCIKYDMQKLSYYRMEKLTVVPRSLSASSAKEIFDEKLFGDILTTPASSGDSISGARQYVAGDALKRVNWKVSARYASLYVKQYDIPARENVILLIDIAQPVEKIRKKTIFSKKEIVNESLELDAAKSDTVCECAAAIAKMSLLRGKVSQLYDFNAKGNLNRISAFNEGNTEELLLWLAALKFEEKGNASGMISGFSEEMLGGSLIVISANETNSFVFELEKYSSSFDSLSVIAVGYNPRKSGKVGVLSVPIGADAAALFGEEVR